MTQALPDISINPRDQLVRDLQTRIKHQRKELRRLNKALQFKTLRAVYLMEKASLARSDAYRHAANIAEYHFFGKRIAARIRRWM